MFIRRFPSASFRPKVICQDKEEGGKRGRNTFLSFCSEGDLFVFFLLLLFCKRNRRGRPKTSSLFLSKKAVSPPSLFFLFCPSRKCMRSPFLVWKFATHVEQSAYITLNYSTKECCCIFRLHYPICNSLHFRPSLSSPTTSARWPSRVVTWRGWTSTWTSSGTT